MPTSVHSENARLRAENDRVSQSSDRFRDLYANTLILLTAYRETMRLGGREAAARAVAFSLRAQPNADLSNFEVVVDSEHPARSPAELAAMIKADKDHAHLFRPKDELKQAGSIKAPKYDQPNPYVKGPHWNFTLQAELEHTNYELAKRLAAEAGDPLPDKKD